VFYDYNLFGVSKILKGTVVYAPISALAFGTSLIVLSYLSTVLSVKEYVELSFLRTTGLLILPLVTFSLNLLLPRLYEVKLDLIIVRNALYTSSIISSILAFLLYFIILRITNEQLSNLLFLWLPVTFLQITLVYVQTTYLTRGEYIRASFYSFLSIVPIVITGLGFYLGHQLKVILIVLDCLSILFSIILYTKESLSFSFKNIEHIFPFIKDIAYVIANNSVYPLTFLLAPLLIIGLFGDDGLYQWEVTNLWRNMVMVGASISLTVIQREFIGGGFTLKDQLRWFVIFCSVLVLAVFSAYIILEKLTFFPASYSRYMLDGLITGIISAIPGFWAFYFFSKGKFLRNLFLMSLLWAALLLVLIPFGIVLSLIISYLFFLILILFFLYLC